MTRLHTVLLAASLALCTTTAALAAGDLPRRGALGAGVAAKDGIVSISFVVPKSAAEQAGLQTGDVLVSVDDVPVTSTADFVARLRRPAGASVTLAVTRAGTAMRKTITLPAAPQERDPAVDTTYSAVTVEGTLRRTLFTAPHRASGKHPGVLIVGGIGCFSVDVANAPDPYRSLAFDLARRGIAMLRLEKSGVGDSQGPPCATVDFERESHSYDVALAALRANPAVDPDRIYIFGHSIGSAIAPRLAAEQRVAGVIMAEGVGRNWVEYELINRRRQVLLAGDNPRDTWDELRRKEFCMHRLLVEKQSAEALLRERPDCKPSTEYPAPLAYLQQVSDLDVPDLWTKVDVPVLVIYGRADYVTDETDHRYITDVVNGAHAGRATFAIIDDMNHNLSVVPSQRQAYDNYLAGKATPYNPAFSQTILTWLCARETCAGSPERAVSHCSFNAAGDDLIGECGKMFDQIPILRLRPVAAIKTGAWRDDVRPVAVWAGDMSDDSNNFPVELETFADGSGILRSEYGWFRVTHAATSSNLSFDLDATQQITPNAQDEKIVRRAMEILSTPAVWNRADDRKCPAAATTWSMYCAMQKASIDITGGFNHRRPALEVVRKTVDERVAGRNYSHRMMDYNNDKTTQLADIQTLLKESLTHMQDPKWLTTHGIAPPGP